MCISVSHMVSKYLNTKLMLKDSSVNPSFLPYNYPNPEICKLQTRFIQNAPTSSTSPYKKTLKKKYVKNPDWAPQKL